MGKPATDGTLATLPSSTLCEDLVVSEVLHRVTPSHTQTDS